MYRIVNPELKNFEHILLESLNWFVWLSLSSFILLESSLHVFYIRICFIYFYSGPINVSRYL